MIRYERLTLCADFRFAIFCGAFYFHIADKFNIIDKPNERSLMPLIVLRGGGVIFLLGLWTWAFFFGFSAPWFLMAVTLIGGVSFIDDVRSLPDSVRLVGPIHCHGDDVLSIGYIAPEYVVGVVVGAYRLCGSFEYH